MKNVNKPAPLNTGSLPMKVMNLLAVEQILSTKELVELKVFNLGNLIMFLAAKISKKMAVTVMKYPIPE